MFIACGSNTPTENELPAPSAQKIPTVDELTENIEKRVVGGTLTELLYYLGLVQSGGVPVFQYEEDTNPDQGGKPTTGFWCIYAIDSVKPGLKLEMNYRKAILDENPAGAARTPDVDHVSLCVDIALVDNGRTLVSKKLGYPIYEEGFYPIGGTEDPEQAGSTDEPPAEK